MRTIGHAVLSLCVAAVSWAQTDDGAVFSDGVEPMATVVYRVVKAKDHDRLTEALVDSLGELGFVSAYLDDPRCSVDSAVLRREPVYRSYNDLITEASVAEGKRYLREYREFLDSLSNVDGIPPEFYVAQYRFETNFGKYLGEFMVLPTLYTWYAVARYEHSKKYPLRSRAFWRRELAAALRLARDGVFDPFTTPSSYRGAWGLTQFMPSQYHLARDGDGDGVVDLWNERDAIASAANHLLQNGWGKSHRARLRALRLYNRGAYGRAVLKYARLIASP